MKRILLLFLTLLGTLFCGEAFAQRVTNAHYQTVAHIKPDGTIQDAAEHGGTAFEDLPDDWKCPRCKQPKSKFNKA